MTPVHHQSLIALQPLHHSGSNATRFYYGDRCPQLYPLHLKSALKIIARSSALDLAAQRDQLRTLLQHQRALPFYLPEQRIFVPFKMLKRVSSNDAALGYVELSHIRRLTPDGHHALLSLGTSNQESAVLPLLCTLSTAQRSYRTGLQLLDELQRTRPNNSSKHHMAKELSALLEQLENCELLPKMQCDMEEVKAMIQEMFNRRDIRL